MLWKCIKDGNCFTSHFHCVEIHPLSGLWPRNSTKHNRAKSSTYMNHGIDEERIQKHQLPCMAKTISYWSRNKQVLSSSLIINTGKRSPVWDLNKLKNSQTFLKKKFCSNNLGKPKKDINPSCTKTTRLLEYKSSSWDIESSCLG